MLMSVQKTLTTAMVQQPAQILTEILLVLVRLDLLEMVYLAQVSL